MSKNKIIKLVHNITGKNYADCRRFCKSLSWNEELIIMATVGDELQKVADAIKPVVEGVAEALANVAEAFAELARNVADVYINAIDNMFDYETGAES